MTITKYQKLNESIEKTSTLDNIINTCRLGKALGLNTVKDLKEFFIKNRQNTESINETLKRCSKNLTEDSRYISTKDLADPYTVFENILSWCGYSTFSFSDLFKSDWEYQYKIELAKAKQDNPDIEKDSVALDELKTKVRNKLSRKISKRHRGWWSVADPLKGSVYVYAYIKENLDKAIEAANNFGMEMSEIETVPKGKSIVYRVEIDPMSVDAETPEFIDAYQKYVSPGQQKAYGDPTKKFDKLKAKFDSENNPEDSEEQEAL